MIITSKRFLLALLAGIALSLLITVLLPKAGCLGFMTGVLVSILLAKTGTPKKDTLIGTITVIPAGLYVIYYTNLQTKSIENYGLLGSLPAILITVFLIMGMGALVGLVLGFVIRKTNAGNWVP